MPAIKSQNPPKELSLDERKRIMESLESKSALLNREYSKSVEMRARINGAEAAYPEARRILDGLNKGQDSKEYAESRDKMLDVLQSVRPN
ncbi:MAG: hypothetical protein V1703_03560, partial [Candidatus Altiarchaeota archaeon]